MHLLAPGMPAEMAGFWHSFRGRRITGVIFGASG